tara:strand:+ start:74 stop:505 length:432 start_codon:yes stop_codon:yes gene_type:complete
MATYEEHPGNVPAGICKTRMTIWMVEFLCEDNAGQAGHFYAPTLTAAEEARATLAREGRTALNDYEAIPTIYKVSLISKCGPRRALCRILNRMDLAGMPWRISNPLTTASERAAQDRRNLRESQRMIESLDLKERMGGSRCES